MDTSDSSAEAPDSADAVSPISWQTSGLRGFSLPRSMTGRSSLVASPPWLCSGDRLVVEYIADSDAVRQFTPRELEIAADACNVTAVFSDYQICSVSREELLDPIRAQHREFDLFVSCALNGEPMNYAILIWVDKAYSLVRGWIQGGPKKFGSIWMTRPVTVGRGGPRLAPGEQFAATLAANDRRLAEATITLTGVSEALPALHSRRSVGGRFFPSWDSSWPPVTELIVSNPTEFETSSVWEGVASLRFFQWAEEELHLLAPREIGRGYQYSCGWVVNMGRRLQE
jgi:acetoacetate decarboxylase